MVGNVAEWVADWLAVDVYRMVQPGDFTRHSAGIRPTYHSGADPAYTIYAVGFRCCRTVP